MGISEDLTEFPTPLTSIMTAAFESQRMTSLPLTKGPLKSTPVWHRGSFRSGGMHSSISSPLLHILGHSPTALLLCAPSPEANLTSSPVKLDHQIALVLFFFLYWRMLRSFKFSKEMITLRKFALLYKQEETFWALRFTKILKCTVCGFKKQPSSAME